MILTLTRDQITTIKDQFFPYMEMLIQTKLNDAFLFSQDNKSSDVCTYKICWYAFKEIKNIFSDTHAYDRKHQIRYINLNGVEAIVFYQLLTQLPIRENQVYLCELCDNMKRELEEQVIDPGQ